LLRYVPSHEIDYAMTKNLHALALVNPLLARYRMKLGAVAGIIT
jgi:hypothetical protein